MTTDQKEGTDMTRQTFSQQILSNPKLRTDPRTRSIYRSSLTLERTRRDLRRSI